MKCRLNPSRIFGCLLLVGLMCASRGTNAQESTDLDAFRQLHNELRQRIEEDLAQATQFLESKIADAPDWADANVLRHSLASKMMDQGDFDDANEQFQKLIAFQVKHIDQSENQFGVWMTIQSMQEIASESGSNKALQSAAELAYESLREVWQSSDPLPLIPFSQLAVLKSQFLMADGKADEAKALIAARLDSLRKINSSPTATADTMLAEVRMLRSLMSSDYFDDEWQERWINQLDNLVTEAVEQYPESILLQSDYADTQFAMIRWWGQDDPEATKQRIESVMAKLDPMALKNRSVAATLRRIDLHRERMASAKPVETLIGKAAPDWDIDAWVNTIAMDRDDLKGKVVLLDFWAVWCGPCIATFPHLRQWREEFGDDGFEIVGVTQYYNVEWDDEKKRATRSDGEVSPEQEQQTLASFLDHHKLGHPVIINPEGSKMGSEYGVRGIPHVVLIDRDGVVQLVKVGAGEATAKEIHAKIKSLMKSTD
ncbi:MAG: redoxin domain-containing protein [Pirellulaceae bacterium]|nr:redoxin domain-containing protein [Pirellulaceae bacterium]